MTIIVPTPWQWQFPECPRWVPKSKAMRYAQMAKILEEAEEANREIASGNDLAYAKELMNVIHACETALREFPPVFLEAAKRGVIRDNDARGYYGGAE